MSPKQKRNPTAQDLGQFCLAVRQKKDWERKIWDEKLVLKWSIEAELMPLGSTVLRGETLEAVRELRRASTIRKLDQEIILSNGPHHEPVKEPVLEVDNSDWNNALKYARGSRHALWEPELREKGLGIFVSDDLVPESVHRELERELDALAAKEPKDYHPGSFGKVQDLIHPSLYPYIPGVTPLSSPSIKLPPTVEGKFYTKLSSLSDTEMISTYAWIPSVFKVSPDGTDVHIDGYINGLGTREEHPGLFRVIEKMFLLALPHFEKTVEKAQEYKPETSPSVQRWIQRRDFAVSHEGELTKEMWAQFLSEHQTEWELQKREEKEAKERLRREIHEEKTGKESFYVLEDSFVGAANTYKGQELKVVVKAANYTVAPGREYEGSWHMEGMPHERIIASFIYYYSTDSAIQDHGLSFRKFRDVNDDFPAVEDSDYTHEDFHLSFLVNTNVSGDGQNSDNDEDPEYDSEHHYPSDWETVNESSRIPVTTTSLPFFINLGTVQTTNFDLDRKGEHKGNSTGRILSFPNWLQHKVKLVKNSESSRNSNINDETVATRKIFCFFLVDDSGSQSSLDYIRQPGFSIRGMSHMNVLTTSEIPMQERKTNDPTIRAFLRIVSLKLTGQEISPELIEIICDYVLEGTLTREEAEGHRLTLMSERKVNAKGGYARRNTYSLCEH
ncbi:uncharacterized protein C8R40DRAFT_1131513 [Lentinula edodes]|uniref:uncharacterized protein n=1 Tax=Lentinula edodes TaxID=5353 RepID=UPI001E8EA0AC|nr:uncharacterized protein C8R40DRAFT_1131513 [Lentinula edodes]KAH7869156.1 hypothetical protein C8R40DRAFT_1131513 [Lentinula edodes]